MDLKKEAWYLAKTIALWIAFTIAVLLSMAALQYFMYGKVKIQ